MSIIGFKHKHQGMTLIEVLVASIIVAIGLLGVASLQIAALQGATNANYRSKAIDLATSLSDRMHANLIGVADNHYLGSPDCGPGAENAIANCSMTPIMDDDSSVVSCTAKRMADYDLHKIGCGPGIQESLPNGQLEVNCLDANTDDVDKCSHLSRLEIRISWQVQSHITDIEANNTDEVIVTIIPGAP